MNAVPVWQLLLITFGSMSVGFLTGACLFYPIGRRHGIHVMAERWRQAYREDKRNADPIAKIAADAGAKVRGDTTITDRRH